MKLSNRFSKASVTPAQLKPLFDSSYLTPDQNPAVFHDTDPIKHLTINEAAIRHK